MHSRLYSTPSPASQASFSTPKQASSRTLHDIMLLNDLDFPTPLGTDRTIQSLFTREEMTSSRIYDMPRMDNQREIRLERTAAEWRLHRDAIRKLRSNLHAVFDAFKIETIYMKLATAFYSNHLKSLCFWAWRTKPRLHRFLAVTEKIVSRCHLTQWRRLTRKGRNRTVAGSFRMRRVFDVLKRLRIAKYTEKRREDRLQKGVITQWSVVAKQTKADRFYMRVCLRMWVKAASLSVYMKEVVRGWKRAAGESHRKRTQRKARNREFVGERREQRIEKLKRRVMNAFRLIAREADERRKKVRTRRRVAEKRLLLRILAVWKSLGRRDFSRLLLLRKAFRGLRKATKVIHTGRVLSAHVRLCLLKSVIRELQSIATERFLHIIKRAQNHCCFTLKSKYFRLLYKASVKSHAAVVRAVEMYERRLLKRGFQAFIEIERKRIMASELGEEMERRKWEKTREVFIQWKRITIAQIETRDTNSALWCQRRTLELLYLWRKATIQSQMEDEQTVCNFRVAKLAKLAFASWSMLTWHKRIIRFKRAHIHRLLTVRHHTGVAKVLFRSERLPRSPPQASSSRQGKGSEVYCSIASKTAEILATRVEIRIVRTENLFTSKRKAD